MEVTATDVRLTQGTGSNRIIEAVPLQAVTGVTSVARWTGAPMLGLAVALGLAAAVAGVLQQVLVMWILGGVAVVAGVVSAIMKQANLAVSSPTMRLDVAASADEAEAWLEAILAAIQNARTQRLAASDHAPASTAPEETLPDAPDDRPMPVDSWKTLEARPGATGAPRFPWPDDAPEAPSPAAATSVASSDMRPERAQQARPPRAATEDSEGQMADVAETPARPL